MSGACVARAMAQPRLSGANTEPRYLWKRYFGPEARDFLAGGWRCASNAPVAAALRWKLIGCPRPNGWTGAQRHFMNVREL